MWGATKLADSARGAMAAALRQLPALHCSSTEAIISDRLPSLKYLQILFLPLEKYIRYR
jgi:hypothetical protein